MNLNKYERIEKVRLLGLNTEENILVKPDSKSIIYQTFLKDLDKCSIRTFRNDEHNVPHYPILTKEEALNIIPILQKQEYNCIVATPIDPKDCEFAGACLKTIDELIIEIADGPGTVRRVTHESKIDRSYTIPIYSIQKTSDLKVNQCIAKFKNVYLNNIIFEFSWYKIPVGYNYENFICWEVTDDGTKKSGL